jgi:hypothetical protein
MRFASAAARPLLLALGLTSAASVAGAQAGTPSSDPRVGLGAGWTDAKEVARNVALVGHATKTTGFVDAKMGDFATANSDLAFSGNYVFQGNFNGFQIWDVSKPGAPTLKTSMVCTGGQGDLSVYENLMFMSVEERRGRTDCSPSGVADSVSADRFRGVRIFDISDIAHPKMITQVQTCRGSHTHTLVTDAKDPANVYIYVSGTAPSRSAGELAGCSGAAPSVDSTTSLFRIDVIRVPVASPKDARIVSSPRIFADSGRINGLYAGGSHGEGTQTTAQTNQCHDITVYPQMGVAAGACSGNGILLDISDPANPKRLAAVSDPNFAYWHSATFNNDASKVLFTDEWGGGTQARCRATDKPQWGADAIYTRSGSTLTAAGFYKLPAPQTETENCVAHNGSLIPVPGRDIMAQAWYQGGMSIFDFTDGAHPTEIAFFDRGPLSATELALGGYWATYWYNGRIFASEIARGLDVFELRPSAMLSQNEIDAAKLVHMDRFNPQLQTTVEWPASYAVSRAYVDQLARAGGLAADRITAIRRDLDHAQRQRGAQQRNSLAQLATRLDGDVSGAKDGPRVQWLAASVRKLAAVR